MDEKIFIKEKKGIPKVVIIVVVALVAGAVGRSRKTSCFCA